MQRRGAIEERNGTEAPGALSNRPSQPSLLRRRQNGRAFLRSRRCCSICPPARRSHLSRWQSSLGPFQTPEFHGCCVILCIVVQIQIAQPFFGGGGIEFRCRGENGFSKRVEGTRNSSGTFRKSRKRKVYWYQRTSFFLRFSGNCPRESHWKSHWNLCGM